jgi:hypothetical protein
LQPAYRFRQHKLARKQPVLRRIGLLSLKVGDCGDQTKKSHQEQSGSLCSTQLPAICVLTQVIRSKPVSSPLQRAGIIQAGGRFGGTWRVAPCHKPEEKPRSADRGFFVCLGPARYRKAESPAPSATTASARLRRFRIAQFKRAVSLRMLPQPLISRFTIILDGLEGRLIGFSLLAYIDTVSLEK